MVKFSAKIYKVGINPCIDIPDAASTTLKRKSGFVPIVGTINSFAFTANLVPVKNGPYRLFINLPMRKGAGADVGDTIDVTLEYDESKRSVPMPKPLSLALKNNPKAEKVWALLPGSRKKEIKLYLNNLKSAESVQKNIQKLLEKWTK